MPETVTGVVRAALADALALLLPVECAGCGEPDVALCDPCAAAIEPVVARVRVSDGVLVHAGLRFDGVAARVVRALKQDGRTGLARDLAPALRAAVDATLDAVLTTAGSRGGVVVVPVPTSRAAFRRRGYRVVDLIARRAGLRPVRLLAPARATVDQRGLARDDRRRNVAGGATLAEAVRALRAAGADVVGAAVVAATPQRRGTRHPESAGETHRPEDYRGGDKATEVRP